ncbi:hypothetical protein CY652_23590 [Burkholderia sp. WAC0059]|uniref:hypothetical protein n=1 Tax=Burkholderia sp. WAC0059 TaxID=2066022 RepID=UPI000C7ED60F|nr:hypothetical protein [Burkholderia sp. WAC0059]PLY99957.1 hypothetical protein CY652_23590 [Burkholderia sp. WAC0059]
MSVKGDMEFINRSGETAFLMERLHHRETSTPALIIIRSPSGVGKSRLTQQVAARCEEEIPGLSFCIVEPEIQVNTASVRLHDGFFLQRCAEQLSRTRPERAALWPSFSSYVKSQRWTTVSQKSKLDLVADVPSWRSAYKLAFDYVSRFMSLGGFAPAKLLTSDSRDAITICATYAEAILSGHRVALVIREVQHCDIQSLRTFLEWSQFYPALDLILEYTSYTNEFEPAHQKLFARLADKRQNFHIWDLEKLELGHLEYLIRTNVDSSISVTADAHLSWSGNLYSVLEMRFQVSIAQAISSPEQVTRALGNLPSILSDHIGRLSSPHRLVLAICLAHVESISEEVLRLAMQSIQPVTSPLLLKNLLRDLVDVHRFLDDRWGAYRIHIEAVADTLREMPALRMLIAAAEKGLRDYYSRVIFDADWDTVGMAVAMRQFFRLCAKTRDATGLLRATEVLSAHVAGTQDQALYSEIVATAVSAEPDLYASDHDKLLIWAASLAYDVSNFGRAESLLAMLKEPDEFSGLMRACAMQEIGRHDDALQLVADLRSKTTATDVVLAADLIKALVLGCHGQLDEARGILHGLVDKPEYEESPILGFAYRFFEVTEEHESRVKELQRSIAWFDRFGMENSKAYSQAATAVLMARAGDVEGGRAMIATASATLSQKVQDRHLLLNNAAAVELLALQPNFARSVDLLAEALRYVRDDYSEATVLNNLALAQAGAGNHDAAVVCVDKLFAILEDHSFASKEIYWPACFNSSWVLASVGLDDRARGALQWAEDHAPTLNQNAQYWNYRYRRSRAVDYAWRYLASRPFHPLYLSHWLIDLDGLSRLKPVLHQ